MRGLARIYDVRMAQFVLKIEKLSHIMGSRASQDLRSPSLIMAPGCRYCHVLAKRIVIFRKRSTQSEFLDVCYCGLMTYQIWESFETFKRNVNQTNTVNFDAHWTSGAKKECFEISLATAAGSVAQ